MSCGLLRAAFIPDACWATDRVEAAFMRWLVSARASPASTFVADRETDGLNELLAPAVLMALGVLALVAEADCSALFCGLLRSALIPDEDCATDCAEAGAIGVSKIDERISWLICCTADSSPLNASVSAFWRPSVRFVPVMTQFFLYMYKLVTRAERSRTTNPKTTCRRRMPNRSARYSKPHSIMFQTPLSWIFIRLFKFVSRYWRRLVSQAILAVANPAALHAASAAVLWLCNASASPRISTFRSGVSLNASLSKTRK